MVKKAKSAIQPANRLHERTLQPDFFERDTLLVAKELIGARLWRRLDDGQILSGCIVEAEAYTEDDPACHAFRGKTRRCEVMFGPGGYAYVYFIYGMYNCLNVVTEPEGKPGAVLIRAVGAPGANGPGKLCREWGIDRSMNGVNLMCSQSPLWLTRGDEIGEDFIDITPRIGLSVAQERLWRFALRGHASVSGSKRLGAGSGKIQSGKSRSQ